MPNEEGEPKRDIFKELSAIQGPLGAVAVKGGEAALVSDGVDKGKSTPPNLMRVAKSLPSIVVKGPMAS